MKNLNYTVAEEDMKALFIACRLDISYQNFVIGNKKAYSDYHFRNSKNIAYFGEPTTFSQWINGQILSLT